MTGFTFDLSTTLMLLLLLTLVFGGFFLLKIMLAPQYNNKKTTMSNSRACKKALQEHKKRLYIDYFWSDHMRAAWIMLFLVFSMALGFAINTTISLIFSLIFVIITIFFVLFAIRSYKQFPIIAKERLDKFEAQVKDAVDKEVTFEGDNIQVFANKDEEFNTQPQVHSFPVGVKKIPFPPFEKVVAKQPIIAERKLEFLILSREYFSICKSAATFNLLNPARNDIKKQCSEKPGTSGECAEYYYSQMRNVLYDAKEKAIRIIYNHEQEDTLIPMKKKDPKVMKAIKEKLRLTERQKLRKIDEHEKYEAIKVRRVEISEKGENEA